MKSPSLSSKVSHSLTILHCQIHFPLFANLTALQNKFTQNSQGREGGPASSMELGPRELLTSGA